MDKKDLVEIYLTRESTDKKKRMEVDVKKFINDAAYRKDMIKQVISEIYRKVYRIRKKDENKKEGD